MVTPFDLQLPNFTIMTNHGDGIGMVWYGIVEFNVPLDTV